SRIFNAIATESAPGGNEMRVSTTGRTTGARVRTMRTSSTTEVAAECSREKTGRSDRATRAFRVASVGLRQPASAGAAARSHRPRRTSRGERRSKRTTEARERDSAFFGLYGGCVKRLDHTDIGRAACAASLGRVNSRKRAEPGYRLS